MADVEMGDAAGEEEPQLAPLHLEALSFVKVAQQQHGLRHNDHARYRQHCTKKAQRLRKSLKLQQGRGKFVRKQLELSQVASVGHLQLPLVSAERSWAWAQEARGRLEGEKAGVARQHMLRRLAKAAKHAAEFARFAAARGTARTALEAQAYAAHLAGQHLIEHPARKAAALAQLLLAQRLCQELAAVGSFDARAAASARLDEIEPVVRFARYQLSQQGAGAGAEGQAQAGEADVSAFQEQLAALQAEAQQAPAAAPSAAAPAGPSSLQWRGQSYAASGERLRACLGRAAQLEPQLAAAAAAGDAARQTQALDGLIAAFGEAKGIVRHALTTGGGAGDAAAADAAADMRALDTAVSGRQLELVIQRGQLLAVQAEAAVGEGAAAPAPKAKRGGKGRKRRAPGQGPAALVRQYDSLLSSVRELSGSVAAQLGGAAGEYLLDECTAKAAELRARRCLWLARSYLADGKPGEARALFSLAQRRAGEAAQAHRECAAPDASALQGLERLAAEAGAWRVVAQAREQAAAEAAQEGIRALDLDAADRRLPVEFLTDDLEAWRSFAGGEGERPRVAPLPPRPQALPMRPILLDCALGYVSPPDLGHRYPREEKKSAIGRLFGWGGAK